MTFWPGTTTPISTGNAFDPATWVGHSVMWSAEKEKAWKKKQEEKAEQAARAEKKKTAKERNAETVAFTTYHLPGGAPKLSAKAIEGLTDAKRHARDRKARGKA
jgi:hypothetical protein